MSEFSPGGSTVGSVAFGLFPTFGPVVLIDTSRTHRLMRLPSKEASPITRPEGANMMSNGADPLFAGAGNMRYQRGIWPSGTFSREMSMPMSLGSIRTGSPGIGRAAWRMMRYALISDGGLGG